MKAKNWNKLASELMELIGDTTKETKVKALVILDTAIELHPDGDNNGMAFHHMCEVVDFCRVKKLSCYTARDFLTDNVICRIF